MTNIRLITRQLGPNLLKQVSQADSICILTSFVMKSGVDYIASALKEAAEKGAEIKICTGDYLFITQPEALKKLVNLHPSIEVRLWQSNGVSFHPKAYLFQGKTMDRVYVGSSNLSRSALGYGVEWNIEVENHMSLYEEALDQFTKTYHAIETIPLNAETLKSYQSRFESYHASSPNTIQHLTKAEELDLMLPSEEKTLEPQEIGENKTVYSSEIKPRFAQIEALEELEKTINEDYTKALVVMATGLGKTYLAAFFAKRFKRILFIAHLEEILNQAEQSFKQILPAYSTGIFNGKQKDMGTDVTFASIYTLSAKHHLTKFDPNLFDLIIVDEFHHAAASTYSRVLTYFTPSFLLGITATPDRNDNKDVYALCDGNVAYRFDFLAAINKGWLAPFSYYGVYDDTDYSQLTWLGNRYAEDELQAIQLRDSMAEKIFQSWVEHKQSRTIGFCSSIRQADFLKTYFLGKGIKAHSLHSQSSLQRHTSIEQLERAEIDIIFTVNLFNEGVDIPAVDTLLFVRPTESLTIFTQQIGRGLRLHEQKKSCVIIDLIGNYKNADLKLSVLEQSNEQGDSRNNALPTGCEMNLDVKVISLLDEMKRKKQPRKEKLQLDYIAVKQELGRRPSYTELHLQGASSSIGYRQEYSSYMGFLYHSGELTPQEATLFKTYEHWVKEVEKTTMSRSYKMVLLHAMLVRGKDNWNEVITAEQAAPVFQTFYQEKDYRLQELKNDKTSSKQKHWIYDEKKTTKKIIQMPMSKWSGSSKGLVWLDNNQFGLGFQIRPEHKEQLYEWTKEICDFRLQWYFERKGKKE